jgi:hypothetical protein
MKTLIVFRDRYNHLNCVTTLKDENNKVKAIITGYQQPRKSQKTIRVGKETFNLKFN